MGPQNGCNGEPNRWGHTRSQRIALGHHDRDPEKSPYVALTSIRLDTIFRESIAGDVALKAGAVANVSIYVRRLLQARCFSAIGFGSQGSVFR